MTRGRILIGLLVAIPLVLLVRWVAHNTYWEDMKVPMPPKGEALVNPFYAVQRVAEALGARATWDRVLTVPSPDSVIVLSAWHWSLSKGRRATLERWVESGGRLVVDEMLSDSEDEFEEWSHIVTDYRKDHATKESKPGCGRFQEEYDGRPSPGSDADAYWICDVSVWSSLTSDTTARWALRDKSGIQAMRMQVGRGSVTVINAAPFRERGVFDGDHGRLFVAATQLRRGDDLHFLSEDEYPSLLALLWQYGAPVVALALAIAALALWRGAVRLGPLAAPQHGARRSLAEQIRGTGRFALRHGSGQSLHAACVRALDEAAQRRVKGYAGLPADERVAALAQLTGFDRESLAAAIHHSELRNAHELRRTIALLEAARRQTVIEHRRSSHGAR
jgi:hypothetical protein